MYTPSPMRLSSIAVIAVLGAACGSKPETQVEVAQVSRDHFVLAIHTAPGVGIGSHQPEVWADANGYAEWTIDVATSGQLYRDLSDAHVVVNVYESTWITTPDVIDQVSIDLPFRPVALRQAPADADGPWALFVGGRRDFAYGECVTIESKELGSGVTTKRGGGAFFGPVGATVAIGGDVFAIEPSGLGVWRPTTDGVLPVLGGDLEPVPVDVHVTLGDVEHKTTAKVGLVGDCESELAEVLRSRAQARTPLGGDAGGRFAVIARGDGAVLSVGQARRTRLVDAGFLAVEEEVSRTHGSRCYQSTGLVDARTGAPVTDTIERPELVTSRVTLYAMPSFDVVAQSEPLQPGAACDRDKWAAPGTVKAWVRDQLPRR